MEFSVWLDYIPMSIPDANGRPGCEGLCKPGLNLGLDSPIGFGRSAWVATVDLALGVNLVHPCGRMAGLSSQQVHLDLPGVVGR